MRRACFRSMPNLRSSVSLPCAGGKDLLDHCRSMREFVDTHSLCYGRRIVHLDQQRMIVCVCSALIYARCPSQGRGGAGVLRRSDSKRRDPPSAAPTPASRRHSRRRARPERRRISAACAASRRDDAVGADAGEVRRHRQLSRVDRMITSVRGDADFIPPV
jgi:hypothetical protein